MKKVAYLSVDYEEFSPETYEGVYVVDKEGNVLTEEYSGNFEEDFRKVKKWINEFDGHVFRRSSVDHYLLESS